MLTHWSGCWVRARIKISISHQLLKLNVRSYFTDISLSSSRAKERRLKRPQSAWRTVKLLANCWTSISQHMSWTVLVLLADLMSMWVLFAVKQVTLALKSVSNYHLVVDPTLLLRMLLMEYCDSGVRTTKRPPSGPTLLEPSVYPIFATNETFTAPSLLLDAFTTTMMLILSAERLSLRRIQPTSLEATTHSPRPRSRRWDYLPHTELTRNYTY